MKIEDIANQTGLSRSGVKYHLDKLKSDHMLVRAESDSKGHGLIRNEHDAPDDLKKLDGDEQRELVKWCKENFQSIESFNDNHTSYGLEHIFEERHFYVTNGQFKGTMLKVGFKVKNYDDLN